MIAIHCNDCAKDYFWWKLNLLTGESSVMPIPELWADCPECGSVSIQWSEDQRRPEERMEPSIGGPH